ncbi:MAG TPA: radical SAM protein, partial [Smithella sp.]|nr:radical SAM protein [Smithella sp.]
EQGKPKPLYVGHQFVENGVWGDFANAEALPPLKINLLGQLPLIRHTALKDFRINPVVPYTGCPFSCKFCSISALPKKQTVLHFRDPDDFIEELRTVQRGGVNFQNRYFFFTPDNLLFGKKKLIALLDKIIESDVRINYAVQVSIDIADDEMLLRKIRASGGTHFFIGLESLDLRNLKYINKHIVADIEKSKMTVEAYYASKIRTIHRYGISIHGSFIFGLPYDYFRSLSDNTGADVAKFCLKNKIGIQPSTITDLPGSELFKESQQTGASLYGPRGTMGYFLSLSVADLSETNKIPPASLSYSPLVVAIMVYEATKKICSPAAALRNAAFIFFRSFAHPTKNGGGFRLRQRFLDALCSFVSQIAVALYKEHGDYLVRSKDGVRGIMERLFDAEKNIDVKRQFAKYIAQFVE